MIHREGATRKSLLLGDGQNHHTGKEAADVG